MAACSRAVRRRSRRCKTPRTRSSSRPRPPSPPMAPRGRPRSRGGDRLLVYDHRELRCGGAACRGRAVPDRRSPSPAASPDLGRRPRGGDSSVLVLARGRTADALRLLDEYDARDCRDRRTLLLPRKSSALAYADGIFYIEYEDPAPQILALRPVFE